MKISLKGLSDEQKDRVKTIVMLGQTIGGNEKIDNYLMQELMSVYLPKEQTNEMDELASLYSITGDEGVKKSLLDEYYSSKGIDSAQKAQQEALMTQFGEEFPIDSSNAGRNATYQEWARQNPEGLSQYYQNKPEERFRWENIPLGIAGGGALGAGVGAVGGPIGAVGGAAIGGIAGAIDAIIKSGENEKKKNERLKSLMEQYQSNIPNN